MNTEGRLEVNYFGIWGTVCDDAFTYIDAGVVCNSLGFGFVLVWHNIVDSEHDTIILTVRVSGIYFFSWFV